MTEKEIEWAMDRLFRGASIVRSRNSSQKLTSKVNGELFAGIVEES